MVRFLVLRLGHRAKAVEVPTGSSTREVLAAAGIEPREGISYQVGGKDVGFEEIIAMEQVLVINDNQPARRRMGKR